MERGTDREREALRARWAELERRRALADRLVAGIALLGVGALLLLLSVPAEACVHGGGVAGAACTAVDGPVIVEAALVTFGVSALVAGAWLCLGLVDERTRRSPIVFGIG